MSFFLIFQCDGVLFRLFLSRSLGGSRNPLLFGKFRGDLLLRFIVHGGKGNQIAFRIEIISVIAPHHDLGYNMGRYTHGKCDGVLRLISPCKPREVSISAVIAVVIVQHATVIVHGGQFHRDISRLHLLIGDFDHTDIRLRCVGAHNASGNRDVQNRVIAVIHAEGVRPQPEIFGGRRRVQPAEGLPLFSSLTKRAVVFVIHVTVLDQHTGQILLHGMTYDAIVIRPLFPEPRLDASGVKSEIFQRPDLDICKGISLAVMPPKGGHPAFRPEKRVVILGKIIVEAEEKIRLHLLGKRHPLLKRHFSVVIPCQVDGNVLILFQLFLHGFGGNKRQFLLHKGVVHAALLVSAMPRIDHDHKVIHRQFPGHFPRRSVFLLWCLLRGCLRFRPDNRHPARRNADRKTDTEYQNRRPAQKNGYAVMRQVIL